jgi:hypothetical protein
MFAFFKLLQNRCHEPRGRFRAGKVCKRASEFDQ